MLLATIASEDVAAVATEAEGRPCLKELLLS